MRKAVAARKAAAQRKAVASRPRSNTKPKPAKSRFSDGWLRKLFASQQKWADKNHKGILERQLKALIPYVKKSAERRKGTTGKYLASRGWDLAKIIADARRVSPQLVQKPKAVKRPAPKRIPKPKPKAKPAPRVVATRQVTPPRPARTRAFPAAKVSQPAKTAKLQKLNLQITESQQRTSQLAKRLQELRRRNKRLSNQQSSTHRLAISNQQKLNQVLAARRKAAMQQAAARDGRITEIKTFAPKEARIKPLR
jgi:hypothetical protein